jgi:hypothetical protein
MKKILLILLLTPLFSSAQKVMVWQSETNEVHFHIRLQEEGDKRHGQLEFVVDDLLTEPVDYYAWGVWKEIDKDIYTCKIKLSNNLNMFPKTFIIKRDQSFTYRMEDISWFGRINLE